MSTHPRGAFVQDQRKEPFARVAVDLIDRFGKSIGPNGLAIYTVLARYANNKTHAALLYNRTIAEKLGVSKATVKRAIDLLIQYDLIKFESGQKEGQANRYILRDLPALKPRGTTPLFDQEDEVGDSQVNHPPPPKERVNQPSITCEPEFGGWTTGEPGVDHRRSRGSAPAVQGQRTGEPGVAQICDRNKGTSRLIQNTRETNSQTDNQNLGTDLTALEYARQLLEDLSLPHAGNFLLASDSIGALSVSEGLPLFAAYQEMRSRALEARNRGAPIKWHLWFLNGEYNQSQPRTKTDEFLQRCDEANEILQRRQSRATGTG